MVSDFSGLSDRRLPSMQKSYVINLPFKTDRLFAFRQRYPSCLPSYNVWPAVHGDSIRHPDWWKSGAGAWGCYRSHLQILEKCYQEDVESYVVFEDDAIFREDFPHEYSCFLHELPDDWEMIYLGGQLLYEHQHPPRQLSAHVYVPYNVNRTHCFAVHHRGYEKVYKHLFSNMQPGEHIDHHLGRLHQSGQLKLYCPRKWLVGQDGGPSNISGNTNAATYWIDPEQLAVDHPAWHERFVPAIFLEAPIELACELERKGWHRGHWQNSDRYDQGVCDALGSGNLLGRLTQWYNTVFTEAIREGKACVCLHHPQLSWDFVGQLACAQFYRVQATSVFEAEKSLAEILAVPIHPGTPLAIPPA